MKDEMTSRERVLAALQHRETDRIPFGWTWINPPAKNALINYLGMAGERQFDDYLQGLRDTINLYPGYCGPADRNMKCADGSSVNLWGVIAKPVCYGQGYYDEISYYPLANVKDISELDRYVWPSADWFDAGSLRESIVEARKSKDYAVIVGTGCVFENLWSMRGFEQTLMDLVLEPELCWEIMTRITDFFVAYFRKTLESCEGMVDIIVNGDDVGQQDGLLMSLDLWERMIKPHHARLNKVLSEYGVKIMYHTDGAVMEAVPGLIDMGIDILEAIQFDAKGMDPAILKELYGEKLCFHGGVSVQKTLPFGTPDEVRKEVEDRIRVLGKNGGYILAPSHVIQAGTPPENVAAYLEASGRFDRVKSF